MHTVTRNMEFINLVLKLLIDGDNTILSGMNSMCLQYVLGRNLHHEPTVHVTLLAAFAEKIHLVGS